MKYSPWPTWIGAFLLFVVQFIEVEKFCKTSTSYMIGIIILGSISITISTAKEKK